MSLFLPLMLVCDENASFFFIIIRNRWRGESKPVNDNLGAIVSEMKSKS
jgi:hypothetical protein